MAQGRVPPATALCCMLLACVSSAAGTLDWFYHPAEGAYNYKYTVFATESLEECRTECRRLEGCIAAGFREDEERCDLLVFGDTNNIKAAVLVDDAVEGGNGDEITYFYFSLPGAEDPVGGYDGWCPNAAALPDKKVKDFKECKELCEKEAPLCKYIQMDTSLDNLCVRFQSCDAAADAKYEWIGFSERQVDTYVDIIGARCVYDETLKSQMNDPLSSSALISEKEGVESLEKCKIECDDRSACNVANYDEERKLCKLFSKCDTLANADKFILSAKPGLDGFFDVEEGRRCKDRNFKTIRDLPGGFTECKTKCAENDLCKAVSYNVKFNRCDLKQSCDKLFSKMNTQWKSAVSYKK